MPAVGLPRRPDGASRIFGVLDGGVWYDGTTPGGPTGPAVFFVFWTVFYVLDGEWRGRYDGTTPGGLMGSAIFFILSGFGTTVPSAPDGQADAMFFYALWMDLHFGWIWCDGASSGLTGSYGSASAGSRGDGLTGSTGSTGSTSTGSTCRGDGFTGSTSAGSMCRGDRLTGSTGSTGTGSRGDGLGHSTVSRCGTT